MARTFKIKQPGVTAAMLTEQQKTLKRAGWEVVSADRICSSNLFVYFASPQLSFLRAHFFWISKIIKRSNKKEETGSTTKKGARKWTRKKGVE